jgi:hypothetical protein
VTLRKDIFGIFSKNGYKFVACTSDCDSIELVKPWIWAVAETVTKATGCQRMKYARAGCDRADFMASNFMTLNFTLRV